MNWNGILAIDKPSGFTSRQIVDRVAKLVRPAKAGHAGTLDPLATGVLVVAVGHATRLISHLQGGRKRYVGRFRLGLTSNTDDIEGDVSVASDCSMVTESQLGEILPRFVGTIQQVPPQFSAVHVAGQRAYAKARRGETMELAARPVEVHSIQLADFHLPDFELEIVCGSGTYVRSIGRDIGQLLGCGVIMTALRRLSVGPFLIDTAVSFDSLNHETLPQVFLPPLAAVADLPQRRVDGNECVSLRQGRSLPLVSVGGLERSNEVTLVDDRGALVGIAEVDQTSARLLPRIMFPSAEAPNDIRGTNLND